MSDQCKNCAYRGNYTGCKGVPCYKHEDWFSIKQHSIISDLKAVGQTMRDWVWFRCGCGQQDCPVCKMVREWDEVVKC
jgi:hypothetical protein